MPTFQFKAPPLNVYSSLEVFDPISKDRNRGKRVTKEMKKKLEIDLYNKHFGEQLKLVNLDNGEVRTVEVNGITGRNYLLHVLCGNWRFAQADDIAVYAEKEKAEAERIAKREAMLQAKSAGSFFSETLKGAEAIMRFQKFVEAEDAKKADETNKDKKSKKD